MKQATKLYVFGILVAALQAVQEFGVSISDRQEGAVTAVLVAVFLGYGAYHDPRIPVGK